MDVPEQPGAMFALLAVFVVVGFLFLLGLAKGQLSDRQQTIAWVAFTVLFFSLCSVLVRGTADRPLDDDTRATAAAALQDR